MQNRSIAIVANSTWNIYNFRLNIIRKLLNEDWSVTVIAPLDEYISYKERFPRVKHVPLKSLNRDNRNPFKDLSLFRELKKIYKTIKPDLVIHYTHKPNIYGGLAARQCGIKSIAVITGLGYPFIHEGIVNRITKRLYRMSSNCHSKMIFENEDDKAYFIEQGLVDASKAFAIKGCGVDTAIYLPVPNGLEKEKAIFTFIGRLLHDKGIVEFVEAAQAIKASHPNTEFWVLGELDKQNPSMVKKSQLLDWIEKGAIVYHGFVKDVRPFIAKSDCIVLPSYREGMPRIILEAMSMSKPVITTLTPGCRETVLEGENGFLVESQNSVALEKGMIQFLELDYEQKHQMGEKGRAMAMEAFNSEKIAEVLYDIISLD
ncbi:MAG: glycosyltransferase family 4 protein [Saprospiraceae bacterium]|nr:glycosyltransferase family 4 protein [Saprospiraceae bacterium]